MSKRIQRVNQLVKKELGKIFLRDGDFSRECLVTITRVETSADLRESKIWISVLPENQTNKIFRILNKRIYYFQRAINQSFEMKRVPKIKFLIERKTKAAARIEELLGRTQESN